MNPIESTDIELQESVAPKPGELSDNGAGQARQAMIVCKGLTKQFGALRAVDNRNRRIDDLLRLFELEEKGNELIQGYSRGMRQKIALAGALIHTPKVIFLDEPTVGLDPKSARLMKDILRKLCSEGTAVFVSTH